MRVIRIIGILFLSWLFATWVVGCRSPVAPGEAQETLSLLLQEEIIPQTRVIYLPARGLAPEAVVGLALGSLFDIAAAHHGITTFLIEDLTGVEITGELKHGTSTMGQDIRMISAGSMQVGGKQFMLDALLAATPFRCEIRMLGWPLTDTSYKPLGVFSVTSRIEGKWR